jgi:diguanylate cyclase (GGDEF)-like protein/PAS domain S-box-containing protein
MIASSILEKPRLNEPFMWFIVVAGTVTAVFSVITLDRSQIDVRFLVLATMTLIVGSRIGVQIPRVKAEITVSDTFIFLVFLLYSGEAAVLLASAEAFYSSMRFTSRWFTRYFNASLLSCSTFITVWVVKLCFGDIHPSGSYSQKWIFSMFVMATVQYIANSGLAAVREHKRRQEPYFQVWQKYFLWTSITYYAGASAAGITSQTIAQFGPYAFTIALPIVGIIYATYRTYRRNITEAEQHALEQERVSKALKQSEEHFRNAFDHAAGMALISPIGHWLQVNNSLCQMLGYTEQELLHKNFQELTHPDDLPDDLMHMYRVVEGRTRIDQREKRYLNRVGEEIWVLQSASLVANAEGEPQHLILQIQDITERKKAEAWVQHAAFHDALTGLPNRSLLSDRLSISLVRAQRSQQHQFAVLFLDLDRFKFVNDSLGHNLGDQLLIEVSRRVEGCIRKSDTVARLGGDEFAVLLDGISGPQDAIHTAERVLESIARPCDLQGHEVFASASVGIAFSQTGYQRPEDILRDADTAMYRAKANGKARYEVFDVAMHAFAVDMLTLERELRRAIDNEDIQVYYQPIVSLSDQKLTGFEALARWYSPERGSISPANFISMAEETGMIVPLGLQVLRTACAQLREWQNQSAEYRQLSMSVNLSSKQLAYTNFVDDVQQILRDTGVDPSCLRLEVTESVIMDKAETATALLVELKGMGVQLSIDDFGTGYSSLSYLHQFPFDILKVDRSFVSRLCFDQDSKSIVETILILARKLNKKVVAEGIETADQWAELEALGVEFGQGYLFSRPIPPAEATRLLEQPAKLAIIAPALNDAKEIAADGFTM